MRLIAHGKGVPSSSHHRRDGKGKVFQSTAGIRFPRQGKALARVGKSLARVEKALAREEKALAREEIPFPRGIIRFADEEIEFRVDEIKFPVAEMTFGEGASGAMGGSRHSPESGVFRPFQEGETVHVQNFIPIGAACPNPKPQAGCEQPRRRRRRSCRFRWMTHHPASPLSVRISN